MKGFAFPSIFQPVESLIIADEFTLNEDRLQYMYKEMEKNSHLMGIVLLNSAFYLLFFQNFTEVRDLDGKPLERATNPERYGELYNNPFIVPVGFELTVCPVLNALITPGRIYYDMKRNKIYYKGEWVTPPTSGLKEHAKMDLYFELLKFENSQGILKLENGEYLLLE